MAVNYTGAVILDTEDTTGVIDLSDQVLVAVHTSDAYDGTGLTIEASDTATGTFVAVHDATGAAVDITTDASRVTVIAPDITRGLRFIKLVSDAVQSGADETLLLAILPDDRA